MSPSEAIIAVIVSSFPRVSGDEPLGADPDVRWTQFSPRERG